ncbi:MAG: NAD(P)-dependent oxidoreductase [Candidatus Omnitrophota bacterium]|jgi:nucleoside-diphosphate-sugar epimerase
MKLLVTGATGFIGRYLVEALVRENHEVSALARETSKVDFLKQQGIDCITGDVSVERSLRPVLGRKFDAIFHCAGYVLNDDWKKLHRINVVGTENVCALGLKLGVERLVYLSSVAVVSGNDVSPLKEDLPYSATNLYGLSKLDAESKVVEFRKRGLRVAIVRPCMVYGRGEPHALSKILFCLKHRLLPLVEQGKAKWHLGYVENIVDVLLLALKKETALAGSFFAADEEILTVKEILAILSSNIKGPPPFCIPSWMTPAILKIPYIGKKANFFIKDRIYDLSRLKSLGFKARFNAREALARSVSSP